MFVAAVCFTFVIKLKWPKSKNIYKGKDSLNTLSLLGLLKLISRKP